MSAANFPACLQIILGYEGGWSDNPADPGGATNMGITLATYQSIYGADATADDLRDISSADVANVYAHSYWAPISGDALPAGVDLITFDCAVNQGVRRASQTLQEALGVTPDGIIGPQTIAAATAAPSAATIASISVARAAQYRALSTFDTFGRGWLNRLSDVTNRAYALANG